MRQSILKAVAQKVFNMYSFGPLFLEYIQCLAMDTVYLWFTPL